MKAKRNQVRYLVILIAVVVGALLLGVSILVVELRAFIRWRQERLELSRAIAGEIRKEGAAYIYKELGDNAEANPARIRDEIKSRLNHNLAGRFGFQARFDYEIVDSAGQILLSSLKEGRLKFPLVQEKLDFARPPWQVRVSFHGYGPSLSFLTSRRIAVGMIALLVIGAAAVSGRLLRREKELSHLKAQFVSHVSHEMRTPAATIRMIAEMFKMGKVQDPALANEYYDMLISESERLTSMINNVLDFARIESRRQTYNPVPCDLEAVTGEAISLFKACALAKDCRLEFKAQPDLPMLEADAGALMQMIRNLLENAAKYSVDKKEIRVKIFRRDRWLALEVQDHGIGIEPQEQEKIFEPFYRLDNKAGRGIPGTGVGLAIVNNVVKMHNGEISVRSLPGQGSTFVVLLPLSGEAKQS